MNFAPQSWKFRAAGMAVLLAALGPRCAAQVSPEEIANPQLKALESEYFQKLIALNHEISSEKHPFPFVLRRYVGAEPKNQAGADSRGLEFVDFHERKLLKFSGNYNAAFSAQIMTRNQRATSVFTDVMVPVLRVLPQYFSDVKDFDGFGFEISYHVREARGGADYEGRENLVVVMPVEDALRFSQLSSREAQQNAVNASEVYLSGERYGLALGQADPLSVEEIAKPGTNDGRALSSTTSGGRTFVSNSRVAGIDLRAPKESDHAASGGSSTHMPSMADAPPLAPADVDRMQATYQSALADYGKFVQATLGETHSSPSLVLFRGALYLQLTLRNPQAFDREKTSLYKRAALSFDTFVGPHLGDLVSKIPDVANLKGMDITVLVSQSSGGSATEAVEFICPLDALRSFAAYDISNQDLIDGSLVIVNGVRISLKLQQVE